MCRCNDVRRCAASNMEPWCAIEREKDHEPNIQRPKAQKERHEEPREQQQDQRERQEAPDASPNVQPPVVTPFSPPKRVSFADQNSGNLRPKRSRREPERLEMGMGPASKWGRLASKNPLMHEEANLLFNALSEDSLVHSEA